MIKLFVNGDSHTANTYDGDHPTATEILANELGCDYENIAMPGGSNQRIIRTTLAKLPTLDPSSTVIIIGWSSFERTEWYHHNQWFQICGDPHYDVTPELRELWHQHIDIWNQDQYSHRWRQMWDQHHAIWMLHNLLYDLGYQFIFFQACRTFFYDTCVQQDQNFELPWHPNTWVHDPYVQLQTDGSRVIQSYSHYVESQGCNPVDQRSHYGADAHSIWAKYLLPKLQEKIHNLERL